MRIIREVLILILGAIALIVLFMPSIVPDFLPAIGWIDEGIATTILLSVLKHYGVDLTGIFGGRTIELIAKPPKQQPDNVTGHTKKVRIPRAVLEQALQQQNSTQR